MEPKICILEKCNNELSSTRQLRKYVTCCKEHGYIHDLNRMVKKRAKARNLGIFLCEVEGCSRFGVDYGFGETKCPRCSKSKMGRPPGRVDKNNYPVGPGVCGTIYADFRSKICAIEGKRKLCRHYAACSDKIFAKGKFKYQENGGIDCWEPPDDIVRVSYGSILAANVI